LRKRRSNLNTARGGFKDDREKKNQFSDQRLKTKNERGCNCTLNIEVVLSAFGDKLNGN